MNQGGLYGPRENDETDLCQKQTIPSLKWGQQARHWKFKNYLFTCRKTHSLPQSHSFQRIKISVCLCVWDSEKNLTHHTEHQSYLDEWFAQSVLVYLQHNVPDLFIRQAERAQENCCCDGERRESFPLLFFIRLWGSKRHFSTHRSSDKMTTDLTCHLEKLIHFLPLNRIVCVTLTKIGKENIKILKWSNRMSRLLMKKWGTATWQ